MTEQTATQAPAAPAAPTTEQVAAGILAGVTIPDAGTVTEREFLAGLRDGKGSPLAVTQSKDGGPARGRFSTLAVAVLDQAKAAGFQPKAVKPVSKPRVAKTAAPKAESVADTATPATVTVAPLAPAPEPVRSEGRAWGFIGRRKMKDAR